MLGAPGLERFLELTIAEPPVNVATHTTNCWVHGRLQVGHGVVSD